MTARKARNIFAFVAVMMVASLIVNIVTGVDAFSAFTISAVSFTAGAWGHRWLVLREGGAD